MEKEWLVTDVTAVRSLGTAERDIFGVILASFFFLPIQPVFAVGESLCEAGTPS